MFPSRGPDFSFSRLRINVFGHKLDTLCSPRADPILAFRALESVFKGQKLDTLCSPLADTIFPFHALESMFLVINYTLYAPPARTQFWRLAP